MKWALIAAFLPGMLSAQMMPMGEVCRQGRPARDLNLSDVQQKQISAICKDSYTKVSAMRETWRKAEEELQAAFDESPVDQAKSNSAIDKLTATRSELFRATSQMDLKIRMVLTDEQWQQLKAREHRGPGRPGGPPGGGFRRGGPPTKGTTTTTQQEK